MEHAGQPSPSQSNCDGVCFTIVLCPDDAKRPVDSDADCWVEIEDKPTCQLIERLMLPNGSISLVCH